MKSMSEKEYAIQMKRIKVENESKIRIQKLREEKNKYKFKVKLPPTSKLMAVYLFVILNIVLIYAMVTMWRFGDLTYLGVLITDVAAQVLTYTIYSVKALKENTAGGITYDMALKSFDKKSTCEPYDENQSVG